MFKTAGALAALAVVTAANAQLAHGAVAVTDAAPSGPRAHKLAPPRTPVAVFPIPGSQLATPETQITFRDVPVRSLGVIAVVGSRSGFHRGRIRADSDGEGGSFLPRRGFVPGETVTVRTRLNVIGAPGGTYRFTVEHPGGTVLPPGSNRARPPRAPGDVYAFHSAPGLHPAAVQVTELSAGTSPGDLFITPMRGPVQWGPEIVGPTGALVWFQPVGHRQTATNLQVQRYQGNTVLTWFRGFVNAGDGRGADVIMNHHYQQIAQVRAGNGLRADLHEFTITPQGTALIDSYQLVRWNATSIGGPADALVQDCVIQEIDIPTGLVLFQWDSLDHVPLSDTYSPVRPSAHRPFDYFHINSIQQAPDGTLIVSARNTSTVYDINPRTGAVLWRLGGRRSTFTMGSGTPFIFQHHAQIHAGGLISIFDDGNPPVGHPQSRAVLERLDPATHTVTLVHQYVHTPPLATAVEGSAQLLPNGHMFVGWGSSPYFSEYDAGGKQLFDAHFVTGNSSYRAFRFRWSAQPLTRPAMTLAPGAGGATTVYVSWNGATNVASWRLLVGPNNRALTPVATVARTGFETAIGTRAVGHLFAVQALGASGRVLGTSLPHTRR